MWFVGLIFLSAVWADKLDQTYLPPSGAATAGGYPGDIAAPFPGGSLASGGGFSGASQSPQVIPIISYNNNPNNGDGSYSFSYETANGIRAQEEGVLKNEVPEGPGEAVQGVYTYTGADGVVYTVAYTADENGFVAKGDHLPTAPPVPPEIQAALEQNAAEEASAQPAGGYPAPTTPGTPAQVGYFKYRPTFNHNQPYNRYYQRRF